MYPESNQQQLRPQDWISLNAFQLIFNIFDRGMDRTHMTSIHNQHLLVCGEKRGLNRAKPNPVCI